ncbi:MAG: YlxR family protein, partial [Actinomycetota bacterium]|nr:YlxR family protein [Actinomycetota bacterium]
MSRVPPVRTCVGCWERATKSDLLRVVAVVGGSPPTVVPDPRRSTAGRGAHLHP